MDFKLMIVEDDADQLGIYRSGIDRFQDDHKLTITTVEAQTLERALQELDSSFDAAIIDLKLDTDTTAGDTLTKRINSFFRIPVFIVTGTPDNVNPDELKFCKVYVRTHDIQDILGDIHNICDTGITRIMGGRGTLENAMRDIFWTHVVPGLDVWVSHSSRRSDTEKALLRFVISHLVELLDDDDNPSYCEEMYIVPPLSDRLRTGAIVQHMTDQTYYVLLTPACDFVIRQNGDFKTDRILVCQIEPFAEIKEIALAGVTRKKRKLSQMEVLLKNNFADYYHWLPKTHNFLGGFINFRKNHALTKEGYGEQFTQPLAQIAFPFVKDIVARYAAYYARQGQPDFDFETISKAIIENT